MTILERVLIQILKSLQFKQFRNHQLLLLLTKGELNLGVDTFWIYEYGFHCLWITSILELVRKGEESSATDQKQQKMIQQYVKCVEEELEDTVTTEVMSANHAEPSSEGNFIFSIVIAQVNLFLHLYISRCVCVLFHIHSVCLSIP